MKDYISVEAPSLFKSDNITGNQHQLTYKKCLSGSEGILIMYSAGNKDFFLVGKLQNASVSFTV